VLTDARLDEKHVALMLYKDTWNEIIERVSFKFLHGNQKVVIFFLTLSRHNTVSASFASTPFVKSSSNHSRSYYMQVCLTLFLALLEYIARFSGKSPHPCLPRTHALV
jgi:hypothetical protein